MTDAPIDNDEKQPETLLGFPIEYVDSLVDGDFTIELGDFSAYIFPDDETLAGSE